MLIKYNKPFICGYNAILNIEEDGNTTQMDFGVLLPDKDRSYADREKKEKAYLLLKGDAVFKWNDETRKVSRRSFLDENPCCLHVPAGVDIQVESLSEYTEIAVFRTYNSKYFTPRLYSKEDCITVEADKGKYGEASLRNIRTIFDLSNAPDSNLVLGEVVHMPGRWSSYPPHHHPQPEVYYYKFLPLQGFGFSQVGDEVYKVGNNDVCVIANGGDHPQVAAPGYAMFYVWAIKHLDSNPFDNRIYSDEHTWLFEKDVRIWPEEGGER